MITKKTMCGLLAMASGTMVAIMGIVAIIGHVTGLHVLSYWNDEGAVPMAISTSVCFIVVGISLFMIGNTLVFGNRKG